MEAAPVSINRQVDKKYVMVPIYNGELLGHNIEWNIAICDSMDGPNLEGIMLSEINQRKTNTTWFYLHVEPKEQYKWTNRAEIDS